MTRVVIVEKQVLYRRGLGCLCRDSNLIEVAGETGELAELSTWTKDRSADVAVLSTGFGEVACLEAVRQIRRTGARVLVLGPVGSESLAARMIREGAGGFVNANAETGEFFEGIRNVHSGVFHGTNGLREAMERAVSSDGAMAVHETLSNREYQVLCLIGSGRSLTQSSQELGLSVKTVSTYRARLLVKLKLENNAGLTRYAIVHKLVD